MPGFLPVLGGTEKEARDKLALLDSWTDQSKVIAMLSDRLGHDVSKYDLDGPLPELPASEQLQSRAKLLTDAARRDNLTLRQLAQMVATGRGHFVMCGTPEQIADRMEQWFRDGRGRRLQRHAAVFPRRPRRFRGGRHPDPAEARPVPHRIRRDDAARPFRLAAPAKPAWRARRDAERGTHGR